jgi:hypothetical protein
LVTFAEALSLSGLFIAFPGAIAVGTGFAGVRRHRAGGRRRAWSAVLGLGGLAVLWWVQAAAGSIPDDALDRLSPATRAAVEPALRVSWGCGHLARITRLDLDASGTRLRATCELTVLGGPTVHRTAACLGNQWEVQGVWDLLTVGSCPVVAGGARRVASAS